MCRPIAMLAVLVLCCISLGADTPPEQAPAPKSAAARNAIEKFEKAKTEIERKATADVNAARAKLINDLKPLRAAAIKQGDQAGVDESVALAAVIKQAEDQLQTPVKVDGPIRLSLVRYGAAQSWDDVTDKATKLVRGRTLELPHDFQKITGHDPAPGMAKFYDITIDVGGTPLKIYASDSHAIKIEVGK